MNKSSREERILRRVETMKMFIVIIIGGIAGLMSGLLGVGGGTIMVPLMVYLLGVNQHRAHGTSLAAISLIVLFSAIYYGTEGYVNWLVAIELAAGGIVGAIIGAKICRAICARRLRRYFGIMMILAALLMFHNAYQAYGIKNGLFPGDHLNLIPSSALGGLAIIFTGLLAGTLSGLMGIGGGIVMVPVLVFILGIGQQLAQGISLAVIVPVSISGTLMHARLGTVKFDVASWLAVGGVLGGLYGSHIALGQEQWVLKTGFGCLMMIVGIIMTLQGPPAPTASEEVVGIEE